MSTFEELDLAPELVEALAAEGLEEPTALQADLIPARVCWPPTPRLFWIGSPRRVTGPECSS